MPIIRSKTHQKSIPPQSVAQLITSDSIDAHLIGNWQALCERALEPNAYLTPMFILPALRHLDAEESAELLVIRNSEGHLIGIGIFKRRLLTPIFPLHILTCFRSRHSFLGGLIIDSEQAPEALDAFFSFLSSTDNDWHGIRFDWLSTGERMGEQLFAAAQRAGVAWSEFEHNHRATLVLSNDTGSIALEHLSSAVLKNLRRCQRRLEERGKLDWQLHLGNALPEMAIERFLALEHMGWKGRSGSSLRANPSHEAFFRMMIDGFRKQNGVFFTELLLDGEVIASTCNLISGGRGFAFKIGWHPDFARYSPGMLNELALLEHADQLAPYMDQIDSGAIQGSFIEKLWPGRRELVSGIFTTTAISRLTVGLASVRRRTRIWLKNLRSEANPNSLIWRPHNCR